MLNLISLIVASCYAIPFESSLKSDPNFCLVLDDEFNDSIIDPKIWKHEITESGGGNWEFEWYTNNRSNSFVKDGHLYLMPTFTYDHMGPSMINGGVLDLWNDGCTQNGFYGCSRSSNGVNIINPIQSAKIQTINSVAINRGKVEVRAKLPTGDWIWPAIWMLPKHNVYGGWPASGEIDIMESRGNAPGCLASARNPEFANSNPAGTQGQMNGCEAGRDSYGSSLHWGLDFHSNRYPLTSTAYTTPNGKLLSDDFHTYGLLWTNDSIITYIDDPSNIVLKVPLSDFFSKGSFPPGLDDPWPQDHPGAPFDQEFYLILNVAVGMFSASSSSYINSIWFSLGGVTGYFPDGMPNKPWSNTSPHAALDFWSGRESTWGPTWPNDLNRAMSIDSVKIWQQC